MKKILRVSAIIAFALTLTFFLPRNAVSANDTMETAETLTVNTTGKTGSFKDSYDHNWYKFTITGNGYFYITVKHKELNTTYTVLKVTLDDSAGETLDTFSFSGDEKTASTYHYGTGAGVYYLDCRGYSDIFDADYTISVTFVATETYEREYNDTFTTANSIGLNKFYKGCCGETPSNEDDYYKITIDKKGYVSLNIKHEELNTSYSVLRAYIYDAEHTALTDFAMEGNVTSMQTVNIGLVPGEYYVRFRFYSGLEEKEYSFKVNYTEDTNFTSIYNDSFTTAERLKVGTVMHNVLLSTSEYDYYAITVKKVGYIYCVLSHELLDTSYNEWEVRLYNAEHDLVDSFKCEGNVETGKYRFAVDDGKYYLMVKCFSDGVEKEYKIGWTYTTLSPIIGEAEALSCGFIANWSRVKGVTGYQVTIARDSKFKTGKKSFIVAKNARISKEIVGLDANTVYYVKVRAYISVGNTKYYGPYSKVVSVTTGE